MVSSSSFCSHQIDKTHVCLPSDDSEPEQEVHDHVHKAEEEEGVEDPTDMCHSQRDLVKEVDEAVDEDKDHCSKLPI